MVQKAVPEGAADADGDTDMAAADDGGAAGTKREGGGGTGLGTRRAYVCGLGP
jgi:hypothetical protein